MVPKSSLKVSKANNSSLVTRCEIGDSLVSTWKLVLLHETSYNLVMEKGA